MTDHDKLELEQTEQVRRQLDELARTSDHPLAWAVEYEVDPYFAHADWLVREVLPECRSVAEALADGRASLDDLRTLKRVFRESAANGETPLDRRIGGRLVDAIIAAGFVHHGRLLTSHAPEKLVEPFAEIGADRNLPDRVRELGRDAAGRLVRALTGSESIERDEQD